MLAVERRSKIAEIIARDKSVLVVELAKLFEVTTETIRGDLEKLEKQGVLVRTYGGATLVEGSDDMDYAARTTVNAEGKQRIGERAAKMIKNGETIFLDASTSSFYVAKSIKDKQSLTVITNAERVVSELAGCGNIKVVCTGGMLTPKNMSYCGRIAEETIRKSYYANKFFFSCRGATILRGLTESSEEEAAIKKAMLECSETAIFLCDYKKLGKLGVPTISDFKPIDTVITDIKLTEEWRTMLDENDVELIEVP
ncbi:MAG: DeoR/GlpR transcriptional regulator [Clostridia bacterium]|nr:DeoR/GlpR transcriptional regulator [Clostridia bacterium]